MKQLRNEFRNGNKPKHCEVCIIDESHGSKSKRETYSVALGNSVDFDQEPEFPVEYQMIISNACNLKCRSCTPSHSNSWQAEYKVLWGNTGYQMSHGQPSDQTSVLWQDRSEWMQHIQRLEVVGGEPFYISKWQTLWNELIDIGRSKDIVLDLSTNVTIDASYIINKLASNFKTLGVGLSIDGIGHVYNYLRHPAQWDQVKPILLKYHNIQNVDFSISHTISWVNAWTLPEFHTWAKNITPRFRIWNNIIHRPRHMSLVMLPKHVKNKIEQKWRRYHWGQYEKDIQGIINFMHSEQPSDQDICIEYKQFLIHDQVRNESIIQLIPQELKELETYFE
jgi:MoaA/NifB/PqqE/SkfB family radical SAM enzyme